MRPDRRAIDGGEGVGPAVAAFVATLAVALVPAPAGAQSPDYKVASAQWNGMAGFIDLSRTLGHEVEPSDTVDYGELDASRRLVIVYPEQSLEVEELADFVIDGGRVLLADDFGASGSFLERLDIDRQTDRPGGLPHERFVRDNQSLPILRSTGVHPLLEQVTTVVGNHPAVLRHTGGPVVPYSEQGGLVFDMNLGEGKVIVFGDASLLINHMLQVGDNRALARNGLRYLCQETDRCRPTLLAGRFSQSGEYRGGSDADNALDRFAENFNESIVTLQEQIPSSPLLYYLAIMLAGGLALYLGTVFSVRPSRRYSQYIDEALEDIPAPQSEFEWNVSRFGASRRETNFALPLSILKEIFEELFLKELGYWERERGARPAVVRLARQFRNQYLEDRPPSEQAEIEREVRETLATFAKIPTRHRVFLDSDAYFSDSDLIQLYRRTKRILEIMGLEEEYERRTRTLV